jgi:hypothetical protein
VNWRSYCIVSLSFKKKPDGNSIRILNRHHIYEYTKVSNSLWIIVSLSVSEIRSCTNIDVQKDKKFFFGYKEKYEGERGMHAGESARFFKAFRINFSEKPEQNPGEPIHLISAVIKY